MAKRRKKRSELFLGEHSQPDAAAAKPESGPMDLRRSLLAMKATGQKSSTLRAQAVLELSREHGNVFVQRSLQASGRMPEPAVTQVRRQAATLARKAAGGAKTTILPVANKTYTVTGSTLEEAYASVKAYADKHDGEAGSVTWVPKWSYSLDADGKVKSVKVTVKLTITLPRWPNTWKLSKAAKAEWDRAYRELADHEKDHVAILKAEAKTVGQAAIGLSSSEADEALAKAVEAVNKANSAIDPFTTYLDTSIK